MSSGFTALLCARPTSARRLFARKSCQQRGGRGYGALTAECRKCGCGMSFSRKDDPTAPSFREWTTEERLAMEEKVLEGGPIYCPVDGTLCEHKYDPQS